MTTAHCDCFGESGLHASTHNNGRERCCDLCGRPVKPGAVDVLTGLAAMTPTPAERLARAVREYLGEYDTPAKDYAYRHHCREMLRKALAAYTAEGGKL